MQVKEDKEYTVEVPISISYEKLCREDVDLSEEIEGAFGFKGLGLIIISDVPDFPKLRKDLLPLGTELTKLPKDVLSKLEHPQSCFSYGWSHGKEKLRKGLPDVYKGSYYNNPQYDVPTDDPELKKNYPDTCLPNLWPGEVLPQLEPAFKACGKKIIEVGLKLLKHCDKYVQKKFGDDYEAGKMHRIVSESRSCKARLLHYFPMSTDEPRSKDSWCGWHNDHDLLTGLCPALFQTLGSEQEIVCPDPEAGLYIKTRLDKTVKVKIPKEALIFQIGESAQILTGGLLRATPHAVQACKYPISLTTVRNSFAVFMQPNVKEILKPPKGVDTSSVEVGQYKEVQDFGSFANATIAFYYS
eukprot:TRINITY_DN3575_c0_g1_i1.p1 TRINITY_DN3575_c0_g1~~TRINITY_DN3575_c0_g1_i1.p1  ORF type:complete len:356 (+),score=65.52 TRINITY_DN3575_c0_g1_i1:78-1145(+)